MDNRSKVILEQSGVKYLASSNPFCFKTVEEDLEPKVTKEGEWAGLYDPASGHTIIHYWSPNKKLGRKWVMGNACQKTGYDHPPPEVPLFDVSGKCYSVGDHYNRSLVDRLWPHKKRGKKRLGALGAQQNFILSCILMNTINA
jgi:hypothetical protein